MKVLVCGSRDWTDTDVIWQRLFRFVPEKIEVIHGAARGADRLAGEVAKRLGFSIREFPADWEKHGKSAGPIRNLLMLDQRPDLVIAFQKVV